ncbi:MAG: hypothetical protein M3Q23_11780 [Actinomycetota bacterium]|nr:hypothetical protein [Actinomycetota bacterium]
MAVGAPSLAALKQAAAGAEWELVDGTTSADEALAEIERERPHVLVTWGSFAELVREARRRYPGMRIVWVGRGEEIPEANASLPGLEGVRDAIKGLPPAGGPVRA